MTSRQVACPQCRSPVPFTQWNTGALAPCPACGVSLGVEAYPAVFRWLGPGRSGEALRVEGEASCFYHPDKKAVVPCAECGRFLCALCDLEFNDRHVCPACLEAGQKKGKLPVLENRRILYDSGALTLSLVALLVYPITILTAPLAIFLALLSWRKPGSLVERTRVRAYLAILIALGELAAWGLFLWAVFHQGGSA